LYQKDLGAAFPKKLTQEVPAGWNSTSHMLQHVSGLKDAVRTSVAPINNNVPMLSEDEWQICCDLTKILKPFGDVTGQLIGEQDVAGSQTIVITKGQISACGRLLEGNAKPGLNQFIKDLPSGINCRCYSLEFSKTVASCTFLDRWFKLLGFSDPHCRRDKFSVTSNEVFRRWKDRNQTEALGNGTDVCPVWNDVDKKVAASQPPGY
jgi:hypothetical protein